MLSSLGVSLFGFLLMFLFPPFVIYILFFPFELIHYVPISGFINWLEFDQHLFHDLPFFFTHFFCIWWLLIVFVYSLESLVFLPRITNVFGVFCLHCASQFQPVLIVGGGREMGKPCCNEWKDSSNRTCKVLLHTLSPV